MATITVAARNRRVAVATAHERVETAVVTGKGRSG